MPENIAKTQTYAIRLVAYPYSSGPIDHKPGTKERVQYIEKAN
jgi:hypothetical protein